MFAASARFALWLTVALIPLLLAWLVAPLLAIDITTVLFAWKPRIALVLIALLANMAINAIKRRPL
jgi:hypothetical protein